MEQNGHIELSRQDFERVAALADVYIGEWSRRPETGERGSRLAASITDRLMIRPATELVEVPAAPIVRKPQPARPPLSLIDKLAEFDCELSIADFASIYIDGNRSLKLKCRALNTPSRRTGFRSTDWASE